MQEYTKFVKIPLLKMALFLVPLYAVTVSVFYFAIFEEYKPMEDEFALTRLIMLLAFIPILFKYLLQLFVAPWYNLIESRRQQKHFNVDIPSVSVLIPAWNEEIGIRKTIKSVLETHYPKLEIIIMNDGSTDGTHKVVTEFISEYEIKNPNSPTRLHYRYVANGGKARAMNIALSIAQNDIIVTIDSDSIMHPMAISNLVKHFNNPAVSSVAGNVIIANHKKPIELIQQLEYVYGFYFKRADSLLNSIYIVGGAAAAYRKNVIKELGGFDESIITEDIELSTRLQKNGHLIRYASDALVYTEGPTDFAGLCKQRLRWKFGRLITFYKYRDLFFSMKKKHNPFLCFIILPTALFAEVMLFFQGILLLVFYTYTFYTSDFIPLAVVITFLAGIISFQIITDPHSKHHRNLFVLAPIAWLLFYIMDFVEYQALVKSLYKLIRKREVVWQKWVRLGIQT